MKLRVIQLRLEATEVISVVLASPTGDRLPAWAAGAHPHHVAVGTRPAVLPVWSARRPVPVHHRGAAGRRRPRAAPREVHESLRIGDVVEVGVPRTPSR